MDFQMPTTHWAVIRADPQQVGAYYIICTSPDGNAELFTLLQSQLEVSHIFLTPQVGQASDLAEKVRGLKPNVDIVVCSEEAASGLLRPHDVPRWICHESNFRRIIDGDYGGIRPVTAEVVPALTCSFHCIQCSYAEPKCVLGIWDSARDTAPGEQP